MWKLKRRVRNLEADFDKMLGGKFEFLPCLFMLEFPTFPKTNHSCCSLLSHNFTFFRQQLGHLRKEKCNSGTDGLLFLGNRLNPKITIGRPSDSSLDAWFNRKSDQVLSVEDGGGRCFTMENIGRNHCCQVELPQAFDGQKTYLLKMPANKSLQLQPGI